MRRRTSNMAWKTWKTIEMERLMHLDLDKVRLSQEEDFFLENMQVGHDFHQGPLVEMG